MFEQGIIFGDVRGQNLKLKIVLRVKIDVKDLKDLGTSKKKKVSAGLQRSCLKLML